MSSIHYGLYTFDII